MNPAQLFLGTLQKIQKLDSIQPSTCHNESIGMPTLHFEQSGPEELHYKAKGFTFIVIGD